jgi:hypothetical protein
VKLTVAGIAALTLAACGSGIDVRTMSSPEASFTGIQTFRVLPGPARRDGRVVSGADDPMINNSIANRMIRESIVAAFQGRGYALDETRPDIAVAFYASTREKLDITVWDYGYPPYPGYPGWRRPRPYQTVTEYTEGTVIVDVVNPRTRELMWRGEGKAALSDDLNRQVKELAKAAEAIIAKFPRATPAVVAAVQR